MHAPIPADRPRLPAPGLAGGLVRAGATLGALPVAVVLLATGLGLALAVPANVAWGQVLGATLVVTGGASLVALSLALPAAVHLHAFAGKPERRRTDAALAVAGATPPVVAGWFAALVAEASLPAAAGGAVGAGSTPGSALVAAVALGILLAPGAIRAALRALDTVPGDLRTTCLTLGIAPAVTAWRVVVPAARLRLAAATLRLVARALGDAMVALMAGGAARSLAAAVVDAPEAVFALSLALLGLVGLAAFGARRLESAAAGTRL